ncbi:hypothetical protein ERC79_02765 [Rhodococcus sp. ABRD24]|uniref:hypothetical protein n=1 Tax=Rhodococcus sp. ABRD24 TaxID=2507582 RepID=UPI00103C4F09|nr:hypothetical protein [Rhodococcus sp. ABRD24]QBJ95003.1 hypothetical protein ERC79_02765 [Rhodococcus sp. ABRD24]
MGLIAVPGIPALLAPAVPEPEWESVADLEAITLTSSEGTEVSVIPPIGWDTRNVGTGQVFQSGESTILVMLYDREGRDADALAERLIRAARLNGTNTAFTGQVVSSADGTLTGRACTVVSSDRNGPCAFLSDDEVVVAVRSLGTADDPAAPIDDMVASMTGRQR